MNILNEKLLSNSAFLKKQILETRCITGVQEQYAEFVAEYLGLLLGKSVWLTKNNHEKEAFSEDSTLVLEVGGSIDLQKLLDLGYERVERVWNEGEFSVLGDILTIWAFSMQNVLRVSILGNEIENIDIVQADTRKKIDTVKRKVLVDSSSELLLGNEDVEDWIKIELKENVGLEGDESVNLGIHSIPNIEMYSSARAIKEILQNFKSRGYETLYITTNYERYELEVENNIKKDIDHVYINDGVWKNLVKRGFVFAQKKILLLTDMEVLGEIDLSEFWEKNKSMDLGSVEILKKIIPGDYVVHEDHGIGRYVDIQKRDEGYYMQIAYAGKDRLYVPLSASDKLTKYIGAGKGKPLLTGLGSGVWRRISGKAREKAEEIARELLQLYALREMTDVQPSLFNDGDIEELDSFIGNFEFEDTDDQLLATKHIIEDLQKGKPMDRLLVGDVGYGKTEIAMRAMFAVAKGGKQVAFLAPTTVLVHQHLFVLNQRFKDTPLVIKSLSRMVSAKEREEVLTGLKKGSVDIVVGTHSLLSDEVEFKDLGLLVVDEEQRFGVKQKEKIKGKKLNTNVLSLTATPIPRTLNMALLGIRDISVLATPPSGRKEVINKFGKFSWDIVKEAIEKELKRGGQVYFLHNRVETLPNILERLNTLFPHVACAVVHGQMGVSKLSKNMESFIKGESKILLCTTIIENGLDIPSVNTLIVDDATVLGLAQMYQIRGRVGRSEKQAYAYFLYDSLRGSSALRLEALKSAQALGSGFILSNRDLEIRGAGDILGKSQSGVINSVGYALYSQMMAEAVERMRGD